jgi:hypothetical protein
VDDGGERLRGEAAGEAPAERAAAGNPNPNSGRCWATSARILATCDSNVCLVSAACDRSHTPLST